MRCSLYLKHIDVCYKCGHLGHWMDVCPNPNNRICPAHLTADRTCKARYKTPYLVRKRRWEKQAEQSLPTVKDFPSLEHRSRSRSRSRSMSRSRSRSQGKARSSSRSASRQRSGSTKTVSYADAAGATSRGASGTPAAKKRALQLSEGGSIAGQVRSEIKDMMVMMQENIKDLQMVMASLVSKIASIEYNVNILMATSQQQQPQMVQQQQYNEAEFLRPMHGGQGPGSLSNHHGPSQ
ncbi:hypothetical protein HPB52_010178 [Rhipicephalus sanguineus]|uniref:CCHC-type domain-containing protein n=1 Tax=Rhipicephalus sanguineus TaxID=34632 RepID=A0A9D4PC87_RHISA|nr:hypothetical protein HPB52_010178 [Rhipicephalus sanguineus]